MAAAFDHGNTVFHVPYVIFLSRKKKQQHITDQRTICCCVYSVFTLPNLLSFRYKITSTISRRVGRLNPSWNDPDQDTDVRVYCMPSFKERTFSMTHSSVDKFCQVKLSLVSFPGPRKGGEKGLATSFVLSCSRLHLQQKRAQTCALLIS